MTLPYEAGDAASLLRLIPPRIRCLTMTRLPLTALLCGLFLVSAIACSPGHEAPVSGEASPLASSALPGDAFDDLGIGSDVASGLDDRPLAERYGPALDQFAFGAEDCADAPMQGLEVRYPLCDFTVPHRVGTRDIRPSCGPAGGPSAEPRHVHIAFGSADAARDVSFSWMTGIENRQSVVEIGTREDDLGMRFFGYTHTYSALTPAEGQQRVVHEVYVCGLDPATTYYYRVGGDGAWSDVYSFTTGLPAGDTTEYRFAVTGDTRHETFEPWAQALEMIHGFAPDFHLFSGDAVDVGGMQPEWDLWFAAGEPWLAEQFFMPANGNHEVMTINFTSQFALPGDGENYYFRYGNGLFIVVNDLSFTDLNAVRVTTRQFLIDTLEAHPDATWRVVVHHRAVYSASNHGSMRDLQEAWIPVYDQYGVDMVFNGHDHNYERTHPMRGGEVVGPGEGTVYVVAAGIGAPLYSNGNEFWTAISERVSPFVIVDVRNNELEMVAYRLDGTELDRVVLRK